MFNPAANLHAIWRVLANDAEILRLLELENAPPAEVRKRITQRMDWYDIPQGHRRLNIFYVPSRRARVDIMSQEMVEINCHTPIDASHDAWEVLGRAVKLLNGRLFNGIHKLHFEGQLGELPTTSGYFCAGARFSWFGVK